MKYCTDKCILFNERNRTRRYTTIHSHIHIASFLTIFVSRLAFFFCHSFSCSFISDFKVDPIWIFASSSQHLKARRVHAKCKTYVVSRTNSHSPVCRNVMPIMMEEIHRNRLIRPNSCRNMRGTFIFFIYRRWCA